MSHRLAQARWSLHELLPGPEGPVLDDDLARLEATVAEIDEFRWEWISAPHFYNSPFHTCSYSVIRGFIEELEAIG